jgi:nitrile hydratase accessory protein
MPPEPPARFDEPWQAQAFALTISLADAGLFSWADWTGALSAEIANIEAGGGVIDGARYHQAWLAALEALAVARGALDADAIRGRAEDWREAYEHTPHGQPVALVTGADG